MTNNDIQQIRGVVKEEINSALEPVKKTLDIHTKVLDEHTKILGEHTRILNDHTKKLDVLWDQTAQLTVDMNEVKETLKSQKVSVSEISDNMAKVDKRLTKVEDHLGIVPPVELTVANR